MARTNFAWQTLKTLAGIAACIGAIAAFLGAAAGAGMGQPFLTGNTGRDAFAMAFTALPVLGVAGFILAVICEKSHPNAAEMLFVVVIVVIAVQIALPAIA